MLSMVHAMVWKNDFSDILDVTHVWSIDTKYWFLDPSSIAIYKED